MINEELENYTEDGSSTLNNGESYGSDLGYEDDEDFVRYRKDMIFQNIDFTKHKTKIGCTIGPASATVPEIIRLIDAGMSLARFNMSHGSAKVSHFTLSQLQNLILNFDCFAFNLRACVGKCPHDSQVLRGSQVETIQDLRYGIGSPWS